MISCNQSNEEWYYNRNIPRLSWGLIETFEKRYQDRSNKFSRYFLTTIKLFKRLVVSCIKVLNEITTAWGWYFDWTVLTKPRLSKLISKQFYSQDINNRKVYFLLLQFYLSDYHTILENLGSTPWTDMLRKKENL